MTSSRRNFLQTGLAAAAATTISRPLLAAEGLHVPLGLQLYSVRAQLPVQYEETLRMIGDIGYREVEAAGFFDHTVSDVKRAMNACRLNCVSSHYGYGVLSKNFDELLAFNKELGVKYLICASPGHRTSVSKADQDIYPLDDWRFMADQLNSFGEKVTAAGLRFGYHNHFREFRPTEGTIPYVELMKRTDPAHVTMEMDCGWVVAGGANPVEYLREYPSRITMLHVKDFAKPASAGASAETLVPTELGRGSIDYRPIFAAAAKAKKVQHIFVEQEAFDIPVKDSLTEDASYMRRLLS